MLAFSTPVALALLGFIPLIIALYFMRSRPRRHIVSTNRIWEQVLDRKRRESILGRFRNSIFLFFHLLLLVLGALALAEPTRPGGLRGDTLFIVDTSASMSATDENGGRLREVKQQVHQLLSRLDSESRVGLIEAGLRVLPCVPPTSSREKLLAALDGLETSDCAGPDPAELSSVLLASSKLEYARTFFFTDNCPATQLAEIPGLGRFQVITIGHSADNLGITAFELSDVQGGKDAAIQVRNFGPLPAHCRVTLTTAGGAELGAREASIASGGDETIVLKQLKDVTGTLVARVAPTGSPDYLACDDSAYAVIGQKNSRVLLIAAPGTPIEHVLASKRLGFAVTRISAGEFPAHASELPVYDAVVSDGFWSPALEAKNLLLFAPPDSGGPAGGAVLENPVLVFADPTHPAMKYLSLDDVHVRRASILSRKGKPLVSTSAGDIAAAFESAGARQIVLGFPLSESDLAFRVAFPILMANSLGWMTGSEGMTQASKKAGDVVRLPARSVKAEVRENGVVRTVEGRLDGNELALDCLRRVGTVEVKTDLAAGVFAVNLFSIAESNIRPAAESREPEPLAPAREGRHPVWRAFLWTFLGVLLLEWFLWHRLGG